MYSQLLGLLLSGICSTADLSTESGGRAFAQSTNALRTPFTAYPDSGNGSSLHCTSHPDDPGAVLLGTLSIALPPEVAVDGGGSYISDEVCYWSVSGGGVDILFEVPAGLYPGDSLALRPLIEAILKIGHDRGYIACSSHVRMLLISRPSHLPEAPRPTLVHEGYGCAESLVSTLLTRQYQRGRMS